MSEKNPTIEGIKEIGRWALCAGVAWVITQMLAQITVVPEALPLKVWKFVFVIPLRTVVQAALTFLGRWVDKFVFIKSQNEEAGYKNPQSAKGIIPW